MKDRKLTASEMGRISPEEYRSRNAGGVAVVLDNVRSAYNVGSAFRSADAFGASKLCLCGICPTPPSAEIHKTALGAENAVPWERYKDTLDAVTALRAEGYTVVSVEQTEHSIKLNAAAAPGTLRGGTESEANGGAGHAGSPEICDFRGATCETVSEGSTSGPARLALIFGNEVEGVQQSVVDASDFCLEIPQRGTKHSLNVSVAVGIVLWAASQP